MSVLGFGVCLAVLSIIVSPKQAAASGPYFESIYIRLGQKLDCTSTLIVDGLTELNAEINDQIKYGGASLKFSNDVFAYTPEKFMTEMFTNNGFEKVKSIARIQGLQNIYITSTATPNECRSDGCLIEIQYNSPYAASELGKLLIDEHSYVEFDNRQSRKYKSSSIGPPGYDHIFRVRGKPYEISYFDPRYHGIYNQLNITLRSNAQPFAEQCDEKCAQLIEKSNKSKTKNYDVEIEKFIRLQALSTIRIARLVSNKNICE